MFESKSTALTETLAEDKRRLRASMRALEDAARSTVDWRSRFRDDPVPMVVGAAVVGAVLGIASARTNGIAAGADAVRRSLSSSPSASRRSASSSMGAGVGAILMHKAIQIAEDTTRSWLREWMAERSPRRRPVTRSE